MSKLVRRKKEIGAALIVALQLTTLTLIGLMLPYGSGPQPVKAPADSQVSAAQPQTQTDQAPTVQPLTPAEKNALRKSAVFAKKLQEPLASQVFNLATSRAESAEQSAQQSRQQSMQQGDSPNEGPTLTTDREDYPPYSYVYISGTGFEPGETVNMIVVELDPVQQSFEPWDVVADENGNFQTSWYIFSEEFIGATFQVTATGQTSQLTASAIFTDARNWNLHFAGTGSGSVTMTVSTGTVNAPVSCGGTGTDTTSQTVTSDCSPNITQTANLATVTFSASANPGSTFGGWSAVTNFSSNCSGTTNPCSGTASGNPTITVTFNGPSPSPTPTATATATAASPTPTPTPTPTNAPPVALCHNVTVSAGANCTAAASINNGSFDPDSGDTITVSQSPAGPYSLGNTSVTLTVTDNHGASSTCSATVTVNDTTPPATPVLPDVTGQCSATISAAPTTTDNCAGTVTGTTSDSLTRTTQGTSVVHWTFNDGNGNTTTATQNIIVHDTTPPATPVLPDVTGQCSATISAAPTTTDNCAGTVTGTTSDSLTRTTQGTSVVHWTFNDGNGNTTTATQNIIVHDTIAPVITHCPADRTITAACSPAPTVPNLTGEVTANDNCNGSTVTVTQTPAAGTPLSLGATTVTLHVSDAVGNEATCTATLTSIYGWNGFFPPVDNTPTLNRVKAGSAIPVKFSLGCNQGLNIFASGFPISGTMQCDSHDPIDDIEQTVNAGGSSLTYDATANQYVYVWKTDKTWTGCRQLTLKLADGTYHYAFFNFTR